MDDLPLATVGQSIHKATEEPGRIRSYCGAFGNNLAEQWKNVTCEGCKERRAGISKVEAQEIAHLATLDNPDLGHTFEITVRCRGSHKVVGDPVHTDSKDFMGDPWTFRVRAWSLKRAFRRAAKLPMTVWSGHLNIDHGKPETREPVAVLCTHHEFQDEPKILSPRLACSEGGDEPIYPGDRIHEVTQVGHIVVGSSIVTTKQTWVEHCRAES